ncbi:AraC family transcriptional regulator [Cryptosporangium sp. NPDC048952]|uniref:helix-turn-helix transcriptional regulator n=1 Tax=Cryptosporangium sp. NPDC048952 TaxID=3363961 RepID=UPI003711A7AA
MSVGAWSVNNPADAAIVDIRRGGVSSAGSYLYEGDHLNTGWHTHDMHQIEYAAVGGVVEVETVDAHYLLPPHQFAWIPAGLPHRATMNAAVRTVSVMFGAGFVASPGDRVRILAASAVIREMVMYSLRWPIERHSGDSVSDDYFRALAHVVSDALDHESPLSLPNSDDPVVAAAMAYTREHLDAVSVEQVCRAIAVSERTLRRQFAASVGMSWRTYLLRARLLRAMALLTVPGRSVGEVAVAVGFADVSAFARAFGQHCGESPSAYRARVTA